MRARNLKPSIFKNEFMARLAPDSYRAFTGLWCLADRKGRLEDRPDRIEAELFPFKFQKVDMEKILSELSDGEEPFIFRYSVNEKRYIQIISFEKHQYPHIKEPKSTIPEPDKNSFKTIRARLNPPSPFPLPESPILNPDKDKDTPSASPPLPKPKKTKDPPHPFFQVVVKHIFAAYQKKKGSPLHLRPQDWPELKGVISSYQASGVMALYDVYLESTDEWTVHKFHFSFPGFIHNLPTLVDNPTWKTRMKKYDLELNGSLPELPEVVKSL